MSADEYQLRALIPKDKPEFAKTLCNSFNTWYARHGHQGDYFPEGPHITEIFFDIYSEISPGYSVAAFKPSNGKVLGSCFYHPRKHHVSLGIMSVHPDHFGQGIGRALVQHIIDLTESNGYDSLRLVGSAANIDSFSLYNRADFEYCIENRLGCFTTDILEDQDNAIQGFAIALKNSALNMIGPLLARTEEDAIKLITRALDDFKGQTPLILIPMEKRLLVRKLYDWGARNVETHLCQIRGTFQPFQGISLPSFLPETG